MLFNEAIGEVIKQTRRDKAWTMRTLSKRSCIALGYLAEIEGGRKNLSASVLESVADGLEVESGELVIKAGFLMVGYKIPDTIEGLDEVLV